MIKEIEIPDNCDFIIENNKIIIKEKKEKKEKVIPKTWEEFCENYPVRKEEAYILVSTNGICTADHDSDSPRVSKSWCTTSEEAEAFLALMQLRQLRKAWVGDWKQTKGNKIAGIFYNVSENKITVSYDKFWTNIALSFPTEKIARDFLEYFKDLCETAKILL